MGFDELPASIGNLTVANGVLLGDVVDPAIQIFVTVKSPIDVGNSSNTILLFLF